MEKIRALVTGGAGFIGSAISAQLIERGDEVRVLDNFFSGRKEAISPGADLIQGDIRDLETMENACRDINVIFHQAAVRSVPRSIDDPLLSHDVNVNGTVNVLLAAQRAGVKRVVYASSSSAYGDIGDQINVETLAPAPRSPYAVSKLAGEYYCRVWADLGLVETVSLRYFNVFGPGQHPESKYSALFPAFIEALSAGQSPEVHWDGHQSRDFTYIDDVVSANLLAAQSESGIGEVFNVASGSPKSVLEVLKTISDELGVWIEPTFLPKRTGDVRTTHADLEHIGEEIGWAPTVPWAEAVTRTVEWFKTRER